MQVIGTIFSGIGLAVHLVCMLPGAAFKRRQAANRMYKSLVQNGIPKQAASEMAYEYQKTLSIGNMAKMAKKVRPDNGEFNIKLVK